MLIVLGLIDVVMIANLLIMVIVGGYETFVSRLDLEGHPDQPEWLSHVNAGVLKVKLATAHHRHFLDPPAEDLHQRRATTEDAAVADRDPHLLPAFRDRHRRDRQDHDAGHVACHEVSPRHGTPLNRGAHPWPTIRQDDFIQSIADAFQYISYYHPADYIRRLAAPTSARSRPAAKDAIAQILTNSRMCAEGHRPICQDTGIVVVFLKVGMNVRWEATLTVRRWSTRACAAPTSIRTTSCAPRCSPTRPASARTRRTTPRPWSTSRSCPATRSR